MWCDSFARVCHKWQNGCKKVHNVVKAYSLFWLNAIKMDIWTIFLSDWKKSKQINKTTKINSEWEENEYTAHWLTCYPIFCFITAGQQWSWQWRWRRWVPRSSHANVMGQRPSRYPGRRSKGNKCEWFFETWKCMSSSPCVSRMWPALNRNQYKVWNVIVGNFCSKCIKRVWICLWFWVSLRELCPGALFHKEFRLMLWLISMVESHRNQTWDWS